MKGLAGLEGLEGLAGLAGSEGDKYILYLETNTFFHLRQIQFEIDSFSHFSGRIERIGKIDWIPRHTPNNFQKTPKTTATKADKARKSETITH